jgi:hypothetical protein
MPASFHSSQSRTAPSPARFVHLAQRSVEFVSGHRGSVARILSLALLLAVLSAADPLVMKYLFDGLGRREAGVLPFALGGLVCLELGRGARGEITFDRVTFAHAGDRPVFRDVSLHVRPGETVALVGPSGSGKTTLISLLLRLYNAESGTIRVDGRDVREISAASLRRQIGYIAQDIHLFNDTVASNIAFGSPDASPDDGDGYFGGGGIVHRAENQGSHRRVTGVGCRHSTALLDADAPR